MNFALWATIVSGIFTVAGVVLAVLSIKMAAKSGRNLEKIDELSQSIADQTRRPLRGMEDILLACRWLLEEAVDGGGFWFLGMTLGMARPHRHRRRGADGMDVLLKRCSPQAPTFDELCKQLQNSLCSAVATNSTVVCLENVEGVLKPRFLSALAGREPYKHMATSELQEVLEDVMSAHETIQSKIPKSRPIKATKNVPIQILVAEVKDKDLRGMHKRACVVFLVGTENVGSTRLDDGEIGFLSMSDAVCDMFADVVESVYYS